MWVKESGSKWVRSDGAVARKSNDCYYSNPARASSRMWIAFEPEPSKNYLSRGRKDSLLRWPIKFKTAEAAMKEFDRRFPLL